jgi:hypothetical protein
MAAPLVKGVLWGWASINFVIFGVPMVGIRNIEYNEKQAKDNVMGAGKYPVGRGHGGITYNGSIEVLLEELKNIIAAAPNNKPLDIPMFDIQVAFGDSQTSASIDVLRAVEFLENPMSSAEGQTSTWIKLPLIIGGIDRAA